MQGRVQLWTRRQALWLLTGVMGTAVLQSCGQQQGGTETEGEAGGAGSIAAPFGITLWIGFTPLFIALDKGFFSKRGLDLQYNVFSANAEVNTAFAAGQLKGLGSVAPEIVALAERGQDYRIIMVADSSSGGDGILARNSIESIEDFKGKNIALEKGSVSHFFLLKVLEEAGLTPEDVTISNTTPDAAAAAYQAGRTDIAVTFSPYLQSANEAQTDGRIIYDTSKMPSAIVDLYLFSTEFAESHPEATLAFVEGIAEALNFLETNRDEAIEIVGRELQLSPEEVAAELEGVNLTDLERNREMLGDRDSDIYLGDYLQSLGAFLVEQEQIESAPENVEQLLAPQFVMEATT